MSAFECSKTSDVKNILLKLTQESYLFYNVNYKIILQLLRDGVISVVKYKPGQVIIQQWDKDSRFFYLLLRWKVSVLVDKLQICIVDKMSLIWEISFINSEIERSATVLCQDESFLLKFDHSFFDKISIEDKANIYYNISKELAMRLSNANKIISSNHSWDDEWNHELVRNNTIDSVITLLEPND